MKKSLSLAIALVLLGAGIAFCAEEGSTTSSSIPHLINYQGMLTTQAGDPVQNGTYDILFAIYDAAQDGKLEWDHTYSVTVTDGLFNVILGESEPIDLPFDEDYWLEIKVGSDEPLSPRTRLTSVGYAYRAEVANSAVVAGSGGGWVDDGTVVRLATSTDKVGIGTTEPGTKLDVAGRVQISHQWDNVFTTMQGSSVFDLIGTYAGWNPNAVYIAGYNAANLQGIRATTAVSIGGGGTERLWVNLTNGNVGIGTTSPDARLTVAEGGDDYVTGLKLHNRNNPSGNYRHGVGISFQLSHDYQYYKKAEIRAVATSDYANDIALTFWSGGSTADDHRERMRIAHNGNVGIGTVAPQTKLDVDGTTRTKVLTITGGSDLAEPFPISYSSELPPGSAVIIDDENPGHLTLSSQPYDRRVAGIVSGAGGIKSGLTMSQQGVMEGDQNIALSGRVYVLATASNGAIKPGDLLTTSSIPGHAMKATDKARSHGAIIGKAMGSLEEGEDLVLVLVTLH